MAGRMERLDGFLGLRPSSSSKNTSDSIKSSQVKSTADFDRYLVAVDMLIQEMHHPRVLLKIMRDEYSSWVDRARAELEQKGEKETTKMGRHRNFR